MSFLSRTGALTTAALILIAVPSASGAELRGSTTIRAYSTPTTGPTAAGWGISSVGDVNGDGIDDLATAGGRVILGVRPQRSADLATATGRVRIISPSGTAKIDTVQPAGDVDGDGIDDLLVTADNPYVVYGSKTLADTTLTPGPGVTMLATGFTGLTEPAAPVGDFDGDGFDDISTYRGANTTFGAITRGGPRVPTIQVGTAGSRVIFINPTSVCSFSWWTLRTTCNYGGSFAVRAGDVNGDGKDDIVTGLSDTLVYGRAGTAAINVSNLGTAATRFRKPGGSAWTTVLATPAPVGDVNGDGFDDLQLDLYNPPASNRRASILLGGPSLGTDIDLGTVKTVDLAWGASAATAGTAVGQVGDVDGDGADDLVVASAEGGSSWKVRLVPKLTAAAGSVVDVSTYPLIDGVPANANAIRARPGGTDLDGDGTRDLLFADGGARTGGGQWSGVRLVTRSADQAPPQLTPIVGYTPEQETRIKPQTFQPGAAGGTDVSVALQEQATVTFTYRRADGSTVGSEDRTLPAGLTTFRWDGRVDGADLPNGSYTATLAPRDPAGNTGDTIVLPFTVSATQSGGAARMRMSLTLSDPAGLVAPGYTVRLAGDCTTRFLAADAVEGGAPVDATSQDGVNTVPEGDTCRLSEWQPGLPALYGCESVTRTVTINGVSTTYNEGLTPNFRAVAGLNTIDLVTTCTPPTTGLAKFADGWSRYGDVYSLRPNLVGLTPARPNTTSGLYSPSPVDPNGKTITFGIDMRTGGRTGEGAALVFLPASGGKPVGGAFLGTGGATLGFGGLTGTAIAIDTAQSAGDPSGNFIGVSNGTSGGSMNYVQTADPAINLRGSVIRIKVVSQDGKLSVYVNEKLRLERQQTLPSSAYIGFVAANGVGTQAHNIGSFTYGPS